MIGTDLIKYNLPKYKFLVFDLETCCLSLSLPYNKVWQASWVTTQGDKITKEFDYLLKWENMYISPGAAEATGYNKQLVEETGHDPEKVLTEFNQYLYDPTYTILGFNCLSFDTYLHALWGQNLGLARNYSYVPRILDVRALYLSYHLGLKFDKNADMLAQQYRLLNFRKKGVKSNLGYICDVLGVEVDKSQLHDSLYDVRQTLACGLALIKLLEI